MGTLEHNPGPAGGPTAAGPGKGGNGTCRWAFIGTLVEGVQVRHGANGRKVTQIGDLPDFMPLVRCKMLKRGHADVPRSNPKPPKNHNLDQSFCSQAADPRSASKAARWYDARNEDTRHADRAL